MKIFDPELGKINLKPRKTETAQIGKQEVASNQVRLANQITKLNNSQELQNAELQTQKK